MFVNWVRVYTYMYFEILYHNPKILREMMALNTLYGVKKIGGKASKMPIYTLYFVVGRTRNGGKKPDYSQKYCSCVYKPMY